MKHGPNYSYTEDRTLSLKLNGALTAATKFYLFALPDRVVAYSPRTVEKALYYCAIISGLSDSYGAPTENDFEILGALIVLRVGHPEVYRQYLLGRLSHALLINIEPKFKEHIEMRDERSIQEFKKRLPFFAFNPEYSGRPRAFDYFSTVIRPLAEHYLSFNLPPERNDPPAPNPHALNKKCSTSPSFTV